MRGRFGLRRAGRSGSRSAAWGAVAVLLQTAHPGSALALAAPVLVAAAEITDFKNGNQSSKPDRSQELDRKTRQGTGPGLPEPETGMEGRGTFEPRPAEPDGGSSRTCPANDQSLDLLI